MVTVTDMKMTADRTLIQIQDLDTAGTIILVYGQKIKIVKMKVGISPMGTKIEYFTEMISVLIINAAAVIPNGRKDGSMNSSENDFYCQEYMDPGSRLFCCSELLPPHLF